MGCIYRLFDEMGETLYVGKTDHPDPSRRFREHCRNQPWRDEIAGIAIVARNVPTGRIIHEVEAAMAARLAPKYGNWSSNPLPEGGTPNARPALVSVCPFAVRLLVSRTKRTLAEAAAMGAIPSDWPALVTRGQHVVARPADVRMVAARFDCNPQDLVHEWEQEVAA